jgi:hypothetical protein
MWKSKVLMARAILMEALFSCLLFKLQTLIGSRIKLEHINKNRIICYI